VLRRVEGSLLGDRKGWRKGKGKVWIPDLGFRRFSKAEYEAMMVRQAAEPELLRWARRQANRSEASPQRRVRSICA
jgi:hypothetical protein